MTKYTLRVQYMARDESIDIPNNTIGNVIVEDDKFADGTICYKVSYLEPIPEKIKPLTAKSITDTIQ